MVNLSRAGSMANIEMDTTDKERADKQSLGISPMAIMHRRPAWSVLDTLT